MAVGDVHVFPGFLTPVLTLLFFPKPPTTFLTCFCRGERRKYAGKKSRLIRGSNLQPPGHESDTLTAEPILFAVANPLFIVNGSFKCIYTGIICHGDVFYYITVLKRFTTQSRLLKTLKMKPFENIVGRGENADNQHFLLFPQCFLPIPERISVF